MSSRVTDGIVREAFSQQLVRLLNGLSQWTIGLDAARKNRHQDDVTFGGSMAQFEADGSNGVDDFPRGTGARVGGGGEIIRSDVQDDQMDGLVR